MPIDLVADPVLELTETIDATGPKPYSRLARLGIILGGSTALWAALIGGCWGFLQLLP